MADTVAYQDMYFRCPDCQTYLPGTPIHPDKACCRLACGHIVRVVLPPYAYAMAPGPWAAMGRRVASKITGFVVRTAKKHFARTRKETPPQPAMRQTMFEALAIAWRGDWNEERLAALERAVAESGGTAAFSPEERCTIGNAMKSVALRICEKTIADRLAERIFAFYAGVAALPGLKEEFELACRHRELLDRLREGTVKPLERVDGLVPRWKEMVWYQTVASLVLETATCVGDMTITSARLAFESRHGVEEMENDRIAAAEHEGERLYVIGRMQAVIRQFDLMGAKAEIAAGMINHALRASGRPGNGRT